MKQTDLALAVILKAYTTGRNFDSFALWKKLSFRAKENALQRFTKYRGGYER